MATSGIFEIPYFLTPHLGRYVVTYKGEYMGSITRSGKVDFMRVHGTKSIAQGAIDILVKHGKAKPGTVAVDGRRGRHAPRRTTSGIRYARPERRPGQRARRQDRQAQEVTVKARILVGTPLYGDADAAGLPHAYAGTLFVLASQLGVACQDQHWDSGDVELDPTPYPDSIEHARNNLVRLFLSHPREYTHLLFWDSDVKASPRAIAGAITAMLKADKPIVGTPYIQKTIFWQQGARAVRELLDGRPDATAEDIEATLRGWSVRYVPDPRVTPFGERVTSNEVELVEMQHVPIGFGLIRRDVLEKMTSHYGSHLGYDLLHEGEEQHHVGLFHTTLERRRFAMEDFAFCDRWRAMGGRMYLYVGEHAPLEHIGRTSFKGTREALLGDWKGK